jgi:lipopolysaccharide/colanic/teichoic acid biosynthesis glycosyltransferase
VDRSIRIAKRLTDIVGSSLGLALSLPLYPWIGLAIYLESPGPILIRQRRAGQLCDPPPGPAGAMARPKFREFTMLKFRSMRPDAEKDTGPVFATEDDPRVTLVGKLLRKTHLDELPQFLNVLRGEMSLVGPRPERPEIAEQLAMAIPYFEERMRDLKPGITGLAQVSLGYSGETLAHSVLSRFDSDATRMFKEMMNPFKLEGAEDAFADHMRMKMLYDLAYSAATEQVRAFIPLELSILVRTPLVMILARGT